MKGIRQLINIKNLSTSNITQVNLNGTSLNDPKQIANAFNNFFVLEKVYQYLLKILHLKNRITLDVIIVQTTEDEILKINLSFDNLNPLALRVCTCKIIKDCCTLYYTPIM